MAKFGLKKMKKVRRTFLGHSKKSKCSGASKKSDYGHLRGAPSTGPTNHSESTNSFSVSQERTQPEQEVLETTIWRSSVNDIDGLTHQLSEVDIGEQLWATLQGGPQSFFTVNMMEVVVAPCEWKEDKLVHLTNLSWTPTKIWGRVNVHNVCFEKYVTIRLTTDNWTTYKDYPASYEASSPNQTRDSFVFKIQLTKSTQCVEFALRYCFDGREAWDNNGSVNYTLDY